MIRPISRFLKRIVVKYSSSVSLRESITTKVIEAGGRLTVKSALNPVLWLCGIITIPSFFFIPFAGEYRGVITALAAAPVITAIFGFLFLLIFDRDKLQSEDYQIRKRSLEMIEQKGELPRPLQQVETPQSNPSGLIARGDISE